MTITAISPRMQAALRGGSPIRYFADVWLSVLNDAVDSQADFKASAAQTNMDFDFNRNYARLAVEQGIYDISQETGGSTFDGGDYTALQTYNGKTDHGVQRFRLDRGRELSSITVKVNNTGATGDCVVRIFNQNLYQHDLGNSFDTHSPFPGFPGLVLNKTKSVASGYNGTVKFDFLPVKLDEGYYWLVVSMRNGLIYYNTSTSVYADGTLSRWTERHSHWHGAVTQNAWATDIGTLYFKLELSGFKTSGSFTTRVMDLGETPQAPGVFQLVAEQPAGTTLTLSLSGSTSPDMSSPYTVPDILDAAELPAGYRYWQAAVSCSPDAALARSPLIDLIEVMFPKDRLRMREYDRPMRNADAAFLSEYAPLMEGLSFEGTSINLSDRVSSLNEAGCRLRDPQGDIMRRLVSSYPFKNYRAMLWAGCDVQGFSEADLLRFFTGIVSAAAPKPRYRRASAGLSLSFHNPLFELTRKVPQPTQTGLIDTAAIAVNHDGLHVMDSMVDLIRGHAQLPARYVNVRSFYDAKDSIGNGTTLAARAYVVRRSNVSGLPDTRIKSPQELRQMLGALCVIADGYIVVDELTRLTFVKHDPAATPQETWADEALVRAGANAIPIEDIADIDLGYKDRIYNATIMGCGWDGAGDGWDAFTAYADINAGAVDEWSPGLSRYLRISEKGNIEASKWLGPESNYHGESIAQALSARFTARNAYPPAILRGVRMPASQFPRTTGDVVKVWSREFVRFRRIGIAQSETVRFMIISRSHDREANRMLFDLLELT